MAYTTLDETRVGRFRIQNEFVRYDVKIILIISVWYYTIFCVVLLFEVSNTAAISAAG